jgi:hypothetical protein
MRIRSFHFDADPSLCFIAESDPTFHFDADPYPDPAPHQRDASQRLQTLHGSLLSLLASIAGAYALNGSILSLHISSMFN